MTKTNKSNQFDLKHYIEDNHGNSQSFGSFSLRANIVLPEKILKFEKKQHLSFKKANYITNLNISTGL